MRFKSPLTFGLLVILLLISAPSFAARCLFVSSYAPGYPWADKLEQGLRTSLGNHCEIKQFNMNTKRIKSTQHAKQKALEAKAIIETWKPDVVITADDAAAKYLIQTHYGDSDIPFVFCGVNWSIKEYGFPYRNTTGMVEIGPMAPLLKAAKQLVPQLKRALYIGDDTLTSKKNVSNYQAVFEAHNINVTTLLVNTTEEWIQAHIKGNQYDLIIVGNNSSLSQWDRELVDRTLHENSKTLSVTVLEWMMPYSMLGFTKLASEQGSWAGNAALQILKGKAPNHIPIVPNRKWDMWVNRPLIDASGLTYPEDILQNAREAL